MAHIRETKASSGVQRGVAFENVAKICRSLITCVEPDVDHGVAYTWHWIYAGCLGPIHECAEFIQ